MKLKNLLKSLILSLMCSSGLFAQDIHFSMWDMAPLTVNPAFSGAYSGTFRVGGIYRDQWRSFLNSSSARPSNPFTTPSFFVDAPLLRGFRKNDWIGVGAVLFSDKAGALDLSYSAFMGSVAYHLGLNKKGTSVLTIGLQGGSKQRGLNLRDAEWGADGEEFGGTENLETSFTDFSGGVLLKSELNKTMDMALGFSLGHVLTPEYGFQSGANSDRPMLFNLHGQFNIDLTEKWFLTPQFYYQSTAGASEISVQSYAGYKWNDKYTFRPGLGYRLGDALEILLGVDFKENLRFTAAYDVNISPLDEISNNRGGFEIAAWYIIKIFKKPEVKPAILCPKL